MPTYTFKNLKTGKIKDYQIRLSEYESFKVTNPHLERYIDQAPSLSYSGAGDLDGKKTDGGWKEMQAKIAEQNPGTPFGDKYGRKTAKRIKSEEVIKKHNDMRIARSRA